MHYKCLFNFWGSETIHVECGEMNPKRVTIYDLARELGISASYISRALNDHPTINPKVIESVKKKAQELNYKHNSHAANLRQGSSKTIGVIVPHINQYFFSEAISGIEEVCFENNHSLIICQSHESFQHECKAIDTLVHQNVDCILISVSAETHSFEHLQNIRKHNIELIQFDRCMEEVDSFKILNDNREITYQVSKSLIEQGYRKIAFIGGPSHLSTFGLRKEGFLQAIKEHGLNIPAHFIVENALSREEAIEVARELLVLSEPPDAFLSISDHLSLGVLLVAESMGIQVPAQLGIFGFANEVFAPIIKPPLSSVDQRSKELGKRAAQIYFEFILKGKTTTPEEKREIIVSKLLVRGSSKRVL